MSRLRYLDAIEVDFERGSHQQKVVISHASINEHGAISGRICREDTSPYQWPQISITKEEIIDIQPWDSEDDGWQEINLPLLSEIDQSEPVDNLEEGHKYRVVSPAGQTMVFIVDNINNGLAIGRRLDLGVESVMAINISAHQFSLIRS